MSCLTSQSPHISCSSLVFSYRLYVLALFFCSNSIIDGQVKSGGERKRRRMNNPPNCLIAQFLYSFCIIMVTRLILRVRQSTSTALFFLIIYTTHPLTRLMWILLTRESQSVVVTALNNTQPKWNGAKFPAWVIVSVCPMAGHTKKVLRSKRAVRHLTCSQIAEALQEASRFTKIPEKTLSRSPNTLRNWVYVTRLCSTIPTVSLLWVI